MSRKSKGISDIIFEGRNLVNNPCIAGAFNKYFNQISNDLEGNLPDSAINPQQYVQNPPLSSMKLFPVTVNECLLTLKSLSNTKQGEKLPSCSTSERKR